MTINEELRKRFDIQERFQWIDPESNQLYWLTKEELEAKNSGERA